LNVLDNHISGPVIQEERKGRYLRQDIILLLLQNRIQIPPTMEIMMIRGIIGIDLLDIMEEADFQEDIQGMMVMMIDLQDMAVVEDLQTIPETTVMMTENPRTLMNFLTIHIGHLTEYIIVPIPLILVLKLMLLISMECLIIIIVQDGLVLKNITTQDNFLEEKINGYGKKRMVNRSKNLIKKLN
jgi:hypothetical protein